MLVVDEKYHTKLKVEASKKKVPLKEMTEFAIKTLDASKFKKKEDSK